MASGDGTDGYEPWGVGGGNAEAGGTGGHLPSFGGQDAETQVQQQPQAPPPFGGNGAPGNGFGAPNQNPAGAPGQPQPPFGPNGAPDNGFGAPSQNPAGVPGQPQPPFGASAPGNGFGAPNQNPAGIPGQPQPPFGPNGAPGNGFGAPNQNPAGVPGQPQQPPMTSFPPAETGFFPAAGFQAPPEPAPEPRLLLNAPADGGGSGPDKRRRGLLVGASAIAVVGVTAGAIALAGGGGGKKQPVAAASSPSTSAAPAPVDNSAAGSTPANRDGQNVPGGGGSTAASGTALPPSAGSKASSTATGSKASTPGHTTSAPTAPAAPNTTAPAPVVAPPADLLHWRLAEAAGPTAADSSGHGLTGTTSGAAAFAPGQHGGAVAFTGPAGQIKGGEVATKAPAIDTTKSFTVSMWINQTGITTPTKFAAAFSQDGLQCFAFTFSYSTEAQRWSFVRANDDSATPTSIGVGAKSPTPLNTWIQMTGVYDAQAGTIAYYVNGVPQGTAKTGSAPYAAGGPFAIGRSWYQKYPSNPFNGYISDVRIYSRALSAAEVKAL